MLITSIDKTKKLKELSICGIYFLCIKNVIVYVGQSLDIHNRIRTHISEGVKKFDSVHYIEIDKEVLNDMEQFYIIRCNPLYNKTHNRYSGKLSDFSKTSSDKALKHYISKRSVMKDIRKWKKEKSVV